ncbi:hydroxyacylglutathione hydrolase [Amantichitinum ursilacus]|uniref:Hydroxyacylglutathione hydrolase n=1 Tax=Amantichitinum ursilacus TaxID=857265 RepID=A0A0N0GP43_9NEIS|nr:hydroxyacylglutathione hydrolase [Amantichitinum ursilacus]KPC53346.1 Hydroxyacylglutathione hydrolase [Amantichitinum ursilacus]
MFKITPIPILETNYIWLLHDDRHAFAVDPGEAAPLLAYLAQHQLSLAGILVTHHHGDHTGGLAQLAQAAPCPVYGPGHIDLVNHAVTEGNTLDVQGTPVEVMAVPGHTLDHLAFYAAGAPGAVFCGDTLFAAGCGRLFEGTPEQMFASLQKLAALPPATRVCCTHEYTLDNLKFALAAEPGNLDLQARFAAAQFTRAAGLPTLPSTLELEIQTNPFLRFDAVGIKESALAQGAQALDPVQVFATLRRWKDHFRA